MIVAIESRPSASRRASSSASPMPAPEAASVSRSPASSCQTCASVGSASRTDSTTARWPGVSTTIATAPESSTIHCTCSAELVS